MVAILFKCFCLIIANTATTNIGFQGVSQTEFYLQKLRKYFKQLKAFFFFFSRMSN